MVLQRNNGSVGNKKEQVLELVGIKLCLGLIHTMLVHLNYFFGYSVLIEGLVSLKRLKFQLHGFY
jgi:hypothetical protein